jgi:hypothetical protein
MIMLGRVSADEVQDLGQLFSVLDNNSNNTIDADDVTDHISATRVHHKHSSSHHALRRARKKAARAFDVFISFMTSRRKRPSSTFTDASAEPQDSTNAGEEAAEDTCSTALRYFGYGVLAVIAAPFVIVAAPFYLCYRAVTGGAESLAAAVDDDEPAADDPSADEPPAEESPADEPPADEPPADEPPVLGTPASAPPRPVIGTPAAAPESQGLPKLPAALGTKEASHEWLEAISKLRTLAPSSLASRDAESAIRTIGERALNERRRERILQRQAAVETTASSGSWRRVLIGGILAAIVVGVVVLLLKESGVASKKVAGELHAHFPSRRPALRHR